LVENKIPAVIKRSADFLLIKNKGKRKVLSPWLVVGYRRNDLGQLRYGCTITRKVGSAVVRNRLKRWAREFFRRMAADGFNPEYDINLVFRPVSGEFYKGLSYSVFYEIMEKMVQTLR